MIDSHVYTAISNDRKSFSTSRFWPSFVHFDDCSIRRFLHNLDTLNVTNASNSHALNLLHPHRLVVFLTFPRPRS